MRVPEISAGKGAIKCLKPLHQLAFSILGGKVCSNHIFNPGMLTQHPEDWLGQQKTKLAHFNPLVAEKAALEERLKESTSLSSCFHHQVSKEC